MAANKGGINKTKLKKYNGDLQSLVNQYKTQLVSLEKELDHLLNDSRKAEDGEGGIWSGKRAYSWVNGMITTYQKNVDIYKQVNSFADEVESLFQKYNWLNL